MDLLVNVWKACSKLLKRGFKRHASDLALILSGVVLTAFLSLSVSELFSDGRGVVYAVSDVSVMGENRLQAGLMGVVNGVASMEEYSEKYRKPGSWGLMRCRLLWKIRFLMMSITRFFR